MQLNDTLDKDLARLWVWTAVICLWDKKRLALYEHMCCQCLTVFGLNCLWRDYSWSLITWQTPVSCLLLQLVVKLSCLGPDVIVIIRLLSSFSFATSIIDLLCKSSLSVCTVLEVEVRHTCKYLSASLNRWTISNCDTTRE